MTVALVVPEKLGPGLIAPGYAETVLEMARELDDPSVLWDGATGFEALAKKRQAYAAEQAELRRAALYCEVLLGQALGPSPGPVAGPGRGHAKPPGQVAFIPQQLLSKLRTFHGHREMLLEKIRTDDKMPSRQKLLGYVEQQVRAEAIRAERERLAAERAAQPQPALVVLPTPDGDDDCSPTLHEVIAPTVEHPGVVLEVADARDMPLVSDQIDLTPTSPPYALMKAYTDGDVAEREWAQFMLDWLREALRVTKPHGRLVLNVPLDVTLGGCRPTYAIAVWAALEAGWRYQSTLVWDEGNTTKGNRALGSLNSAARPHPVDSSEMLAIFSKGEWGPSSDGADTILPMEWQEYGRGPWRFPGESRAWEGHPAAFPLELPRRCIRLFSRAGDVVLDPFAGSGTTIIAAVEEGRKAVGFDTSDAYIASIRRRLADAQRPERPR